MGVVRDVTIDQLTQAVTGISTSGMSDTTGQAINTTLGTLGKDTSLQDINTTLQSLVGAISPSAANVTFDNTGTDLTASNTQAALTELDSTKQNNVVCGSLSNIDFNDYRTEGNYWVTSSASNAPTSGYCFLEVIQVSPTVCMQRVTKYATSGANMGITWVRWFGNNQWYAWVNIARENTVTIERASGVSSSVPLPGVSRRGNVVIIHFATLIPAGTYTNLYKVTPAPNEQQHIICSFNNSTYSITVLSDGTVKFNNSVTISSSQYIIGQMVYLTD